MLGLNFACFTDLSTTMTTTFPCAVESDRSCLRPVDSTQSPIHPELAIDNDLCPRCLALTSYNHGSKLLRPSTSSSLSSFSISEPRTDSTYSRMKRWARLPLKLTPSRGWIVGSSDATVRGTSRPLLSLEVDEDDDPNSEMAFDAVQFGEQAIHSLIHSALLCSVLDLPGHFSLLLLLLLGLRRCRRHRRRRLLLLHHALVTSCLWLVGIVSLGLGGRIAFSLEWR